MQDQRAPVSLCVLRLVAVGVNTGLASGSLGLWVMAYAQRLTWRADFTAFYTGWSLVINGLGHSLYDYRLQTMTQQQMLGGRTLAGGLLAFYYPPHVALLFAPIAHLSLDQAYLAWSALQLVLTVWLCRKVWEHLRDQGMGVRTRWLVITAAIALPAVGTTLLLGALSTFLLLCQLYFAFALRRGDDLQAGLWAALMTLKPQVAVIPVLVLLAARRWKAVAVVICCGLATFVGTSLMLGGGVWVDFVRALSATFGAGESLGVAPAAMVSLRGILASLIGDAWPGAVTAASLVGFLISVVVTVWLWFGARPTTWDFDLRMATTLLLGIMFNLHANPQDGVFVIGPVLLYWDYLRRAGRGAVLFGVLALICPSLFWINERVLTTKLQATSVAMAALLFLVLRSLLTGDAERS